MDLQSFISYSLFAVFFCDALFGIILLRHNPRRNPLHVYVAVISSVFAAWSLFAGLTYFSASRGISYDFFYRACWIGWFAIPLMVGVIYHVRERKSLILQRTAQVLFVVWGIIYLLVLGTDLVEQAPASLIPFEDRGGSLEAPIRALGGFLILLVMLQLYRAQRESSGIKRLKLNYFLAGTLFTAGAAAFVAGFLQVLDKPSIDPALGSYLSLPWLATTYYAITRHRLFGINVIVSNAVTLLVLLVVLAAMHVGLFNLFQSYIGATAAIIVSLACVILILHFTPLRRSAEQVINGIILKGRYQYQDILAQSARAIVTILDLDELLRHIIKTTGATFACNVSIFLPDRNGAYAFRWGSKRPHGDAQCRLDPLLVEFIKGEGRAVACEEREFLELGEKDERYEMMNSLGISVAVPLLYQNELRGVLLLGERENKDPYLKKDLELLDALASQLSVAVENARLYEEAVTDDLSGLYDQRYLRRRLREEAERAVRQGMPLSLLLIDIDDFGRVNNRYGRAVGDRVIGDTAIVIKSMLRAEDIAARFAGEEFAVILPGTESAQACVLGEQIRDRVERVLFEQELNFTVSIGVGSCAPAGVGCSGEILLRTTEEALRQAKRGGKNRVGLIAR